jgi:DNA polymerase I-like protein with 3'-5' exonuclease and polymerase domains
VLSGDQNMITAYTSGDPYLWFAKLAAAVPADATKKSHEHKRDLFKTCMLGVNYAMGEYTLACRTGLSIVEARELLLKHRMTFPRFWAWSDSVVDHAMLTKRIRTVFGWQQQLSGDDVNPRSLRNFPMQANGAEMMRIAATLAVERGIQVCAPVHDAFLIEASIEDIDGAVADMRAAMVDASRAVLGGFSLRADAKIIRYPDRYSDPRGVVMWDRVFGLLNKKDIADAA